MPTWHLQEHHANKPTTDHDYFERMSRVILVSGLSWRTLEKKWLGVKNAFANFEIDTVAGFEEPEIEALMANPDVMRNLPKIRAPASLTAVAQGVLVHSRQGRWKEQVWP